MKQIELDSLLGEHTLTGVLLGTCQIPEGQYNEGDSVNFIALILDGVCYRAMEDPDDGYRSSMDYLEELPSPLEGMTLFAPHKVVAKKAADSEYDKNDYLEFVDCETGKIVAEVGTDAVDDYYPGFVGRFDPKGLAVNNLAKDKRSS